MKPPYPFTPADDAAINSMRTEGAAYALVVDLRAAASADAAPPGRNATHVRPGERMVRPLD